MSGLGQYDFVDPGYGYEFDVPDIDYSYLDYTWTDPSALDFSYYDPGYAYDPGVYDVGVYDDWATVDWGTDPYTDWSYDFPDYSLGTDVFTDVPSDPFYDASYDFGYDTMPSDYGDVYSAGQYDAWGFDPATGTGVTTQPATDWSAWEDAGAAESAAAFNDAASAAASFSFQFPDVDWNKLLQTGVNIYKLYSQLQQPTLPTGTARPPGSSTTQPTVRINPQTGQPQIMVTDPRTGQLVPAARDPATGQYVPASMAGGMLGPDLIAGVPNWALLAGAGVLVFVLMQKPGGSAPRRRRRRR